MPEMDLKPDHFSDGAAYAKAIVLGLMLFPDDACKRVGFLMATFEDAARSWARARGEPLRIEYSAGALDPDLPRGSSLTMAQEAHAPVVSRTQAARQYGLGSDRSAGKIAAGVLARALQMDARGKQVSLDAMLAEESAALPHSKGARPRDLRAHWIKFRPVAHLWLATSFARDAADPSTRLMEQLRFADTVRRQGERIRHPKAARAILERNEAWTLPAETERFIIDAL